MNLSNHPLSKIKQMLSLLLIGLFANSPTAIAQITPEVALQQLDGYHAAYPQEKVYLHHDKTFYASGETLWFKAYLVDAIEHAFLTPSQIVHVELVNPEEKVVQKLTLEIKNGGAAGDIYISPDWAVGNYQLRAYTQYMRNFEKPFFYQKEIPIYGTIEKAMFAFRKQAGDTLTTDFDFQLFPEGGDLVEGLSSKVGFKAINQEGKGIPITGEVIDSDGKVVAKIATIKSGLGSFSLPTEKGKSYQAKVTSKQQTKTIDLPTPLSAGYVMRINNRDKENIILKIKTNIPNGLDQAFLIGQIRGQAFISLAELSDGRVYRLPKKGLPEGIAQLTLFNGNGQPVAERLVYINQTVSAKQAQLSTNKSTLGKREKVELKVELPKTPDFDATNLSLSVTDLYVNPNSVNASSIKSYFLLESDLKGSIENPGYYFEKEDATRRQVLDLLLVTQGWRRFVWQDILKSKAPALDHPIENSLTISGVVTKKDKKNQPVVADVYFSSLSGNMLVNEVTTKEDGRFAFSELQFKDTTTVLIQANIFSEKKKKKKKSKGVEFGVEGNRNVSIYLDELTSPILDKSLAIPTTHGTYEQAGEEIYAIDFNRLQTLSNENMWEIDFDEVVVVGRKAEVLDEWHKDKTLYGEPDQRVSLDSFPSSYHNNIFDFLRGKVAGVEIIGSGFNKAARIRGINSITLETTATILLDGVPVESALANSIDPSRIAFVDVLKSMSKTSIYGAAGSGGIIALFTRPPGVTSNRVVVNNGMLNIQHTGYYQAKSFYSPKYENTTSREKDYRVTLFWEPVVSLDKKNTATLEFYTADRASNYRVSLEGLSKKGKIIQQQLTFGVQ